MKKSVETVKEMGPRSYLPGSVRHTVKARAGIGPSLPKFHIAIVPFRSILKAEVHVEALDLARWQFGITTVYHFIFVPLTIGLTPLVALLQTIWHKTGKDE